MTDYNHYVSSCCIKARWPGIEAFEQAAQDKATFLNFVADYRHKYSTMMGFGINDASHRYILDLRDDIKERIKPCGHRIMKLAINTGVRRAVEDVYAVLSWNIQFDPSSFMFHACEHGSAEVVAWLFERGARSSDGWKDELKAAIKANNAETINVLLGNGGDIKGWGLEYAISHSCSDDVIGIMVDIDVDNKERNLLCAFEHGNREMAATLINQGANLRLIENHAIRVCVENSYDKLLKLLRDHNVDFSSKPGLLEHAVNVLKDSHDSCDSEERYSPLRVVDILIGAGAKSIRPPSQHGRSFSRYAYFESGKNMFGEESTDEESTDKESTSVENADEKTADEKPADEEPAVEKPTDEKPADENPADENPADEKPADEKPADEETADYNKTSAHFGEEVLYELQKMKYYGFIDDIICKEIEHENRAKPAESFALCKAAEQGHVSIVRRLIAAGADVRARENHAFRWAAANGHAEVLKILFEAGADPHALQDAALYMASNQGHTVAVAYLLSFDKYKYHDCALYAAVINGHYEIVDLLIRAGARFNTKGFPCWFAENGENQGTALDGDESDYVVPEENGFMVLTRLLSAGYYPEEFDYSRMLASAAHKGQEEIVRLLLK